MAAFDSVARATLSRREEEMELTQCAMREWTILVVRGIFHPEVEINEGGCSFGSSACG